MSPEQKVNLEMQFLRSGHLPCQLPKRFIVVILGFLGMFNVYAMRMNLSVAIVAMVNTNSSLPENNTLLYTECPAEDRREEAITESESKAPRYNWDSVTQNHIIGAFFYGYFITVIIGGYLAEKFGAHKLFGAGIFMTSILTLLTPITVQWGLIPFIILRVLEGLCEGVTFPSMASVESRWAPKMERSRMHSIIFSGTLIGNVVSFSVSGWLCSIDLLGGWPSAFYVFGVIGCAWYLFWCVFVYESPFKHPSITSDEFMLYKDSTKISKKQLKVPWLSIFTSIPFWAMVLAFMGGFFADTITYTELPLYFSSALHNDVKYVRLVYIHLCQV
ncbi:unnamed protein product [Larinioides sclopetarius]|uniref:Major facilitator superfamily (MFS) profile domain-containing protein n=1 Tax=Larinioides sclopetarius TaxID=280406 RepID=A0AAV2ABC4_9ARAC